MSENYDNKKSINDNGVDYSKFYLSNYRETGKGNYDYEVIETDDNEVPRLKAIRPDLIDSVPYQETHIVEKVNNQPNNSPNTTNGTPKKPKKSKKRKFAIVFFSVLLCCCFVMLIADSFTDGYILDTASKILFNKSVNTKTYYAVELASFTDFNSAKVCSNEVRGMDGAGYVVNDELFRVIADVYNSKKDAMSVSSKLNINGYLSTIYVFKMTPPNYSLLPMSTRNISKKLLGYYDNIYTQLHELVVNLEEHNTDTATALIEITALHEGMKDKLAEYETNVDGDIENPNILKIRMQLIAVIGGLENLMNTKVSEKTLLSDIRYTSVMVLNTHRAMIASLA